MVRWWWITGFSCFKQGRTWGVRSGPNLGSSLWAEPGEFALGRTRGVRSGPNPGRSLWAEPGEFALGRTRGVRSGPNPGSSLWVGPGELALGWTWGVCSGPTLRSLLWAELKVQSPWFDAVPSRSWHLPIKYKYSAEHRLLFCRLLQ